MYYIFYANGLNWSIAVCNLSVKNKKKGDVKSGGCKVGECNWRVRTTCKFDARMKEVLSWKGLNL